MFWCFQKKTELVKKVTVRHRETAVKALDPLLSSAWGERRPGIPGP